MPHVIVEYSTNLEADVDIAALLRAVHAAALASGVFPIGGLRTRAAPRTSYVVADGHPDNSFIHLQVRIGSGRTPDVRQRAAEQIFSAVRTETAEVFKIRPLGLTLEIVEIDPVGSMKHNNLHDIVEQRRAATKTSNG
jgi:5-carboxymethyl-2-hydroxymuconate isomerase